MNPSNADRTESLPTFNPLKIFIPVLMTLLLISVMAQWYASNISFPRYCKNPEKTLLNLGKLLDLNETPDKSQRRQYMIAAKLLFLHPKQNDESRHEYLQRLHYLLMKKCG